MGEGAGMERVSTEGRGPPIQEGVKGKAEAIGDSPGGPFSQRLSSRGKEREGGGKRTASRAEGEKRAGRTRA